MKKFELEESNDAPDLTPMIDVVFLLIVFFLVVAQRLSEQYIEMKELPVAKRGEVKEEPPTRTIISIIQREGEGIKYYWGELKLDGPEQIGYYVSQHPEQAVFLRVGKNVVHSVVQNAMREIGDAGQADVIFGVYTADMSTPPGN